jgi:hypothetical protein
MSAVDKRFVVDIAHSLGMSHANVYRFFKTKTEISKLIPGPGMWWVAGFDEQLINKES